MISYLKGKVLLKFSNFIILNVNDVGYKVFLNENQLSVLSIGGEVEFFVHQHIREDSLDLYGFSHFEQLEMFNLLLSVSGIGPKSALGIMSIAGVNDIKQAIAMGDISLLTKVSGIGRKTAERVVLDLRDKVGFLSAVEGGAEIKRGDEIDALIALGYSMSEAREAIAKVGKDVVDSGQRLKEALKNIKK